MHVDVTGVQALTRRQSDESCTGPVARRSAAEAPRLVSGPRTVASAVTVAALALGPAAAAAPANAAGGAGATYVALGDSYAAGEGLGPYEVGSEHNPNGEPNTDPAKNTCHRSMADAYGSLNQVSPLVLPELPMSQRSFWACAGAVAADLTASQGVLAIGDGHYQASQPAQYLAVDERTNWVSASLGGTTSASAILERRAPHIPPVRLSRRSLVCLTSHVLKP
jgi:hypothetical protein